MRAVIGFILAGLLTFPGAVIGQSGANQAASADLLIAYYAMTGTTQGM